VHQTGHAIEGPDFSVIPAWAGGWLGSFSGGGGSVADAWYEALCVIADHRPAAFWQLSDGAAFWWMPDRSRLGPDRFTAEPFTYAEVVSITLFDAVRMGHEVFACDWPSLRSRLLGLRGLRVEELRDVRLPPATPPNRAMRLTRPATSVSGTSLLDDAGRDV
jgi:hypothetical protein